MNLEKELKQSKPLDPLQRAMLNVLFTASWLDCLLNRLLRPYGLTNPQYNILRILKGSASTGLSVLDIKGRMIDRSSNVSRLVEKLRERGLVERIIHSDDRRMVIVTISDTGKQMLIEIENTGALEREKPGRSLSLKETEQLAYLLDKYRE